MSPNDVWQLSVVGTVTGQQHVHTLHFQETSLFTEGSDLVNAYVAGALAAYRGCFPLGTPCAQMIRAAKVCGSVPLPAPTEFQPVGADITGLRPSSSSDLQPPFLAGLVSEKTGVAGRRYAGRFFLGGLFEKDTIGSDMQAEWIAAANAYCNALKAAFVTPSEVGWRLFVFSRLLANGRAANTPGQPPAAVQAVQCQNAGAPVVNLIVSGRPTTMRSRKLGHGI